MSEEKFRLILESFDASQRERLLAALARLSRRPEEKVACYLEDLPRELGKGLSREAVEHLSEALTREGAQVRVVAEADSGGTATRAASPPAGGTGSGAPAAPLQGTVGPPPSSPTEPPPSLGLVRRLSWAFRLAWTSKKTIIGVWLIWLAGVLLLGALMAVVGPAVVPDPLASSAERFRQVLAAVTSPGIVAAFVVQSLASFLIGAWQQAGLLRLPAAWFEAGGRPALGPLARQAWRRTPDFAATLALIGLMPALALLPLLGMLDPADGMSPAVALLMAVLWVALLVVMLGLSFAVAAAANEPLGPLEALQRGWRLSAGLKLRLFGNLLVFLIVVVAGMVVLQLGIAALMAGLGVLGGPALALGGVAAFIAYALAVLVIASAGTFLVALFYLEARVRKEGWAPPWRVAPHPDWPLGEEEDNGAERSAGTAWRSFALVNGVALAGVATAAALLLPPWLERLETLISVQQTRMQQVPEGEAPGRVGKPGARVPVHSRGSGLWTDAFFDDVNDPKLWIKLIDEGLEEAPPGEVRIRIHAVEDAAGRNLYNASSDFETEFFEKLQWMDNVQGEGMVAIRTVHLLPGTTESDIAVVRGELIRVRPGSDVVERQGFSVRPGQPARLSEAVENPEVVSMRGTFSAREADAMTEEDLNDAAYEAYMAGRYQDAIAFLDRSLAMNPQNSWAYYIRGWSYWKLGEKDPAYEDVAVACDLGYQDACKLRR